MPLRKAARLARGQEGAARFEHGVARPPVLGALHRGAQHAGQPHGRDRRREAAQLCSGMSRGSPGRAQDPRTRRRHRGAHRRLREAGPVRRGEEAQRAGRDPADHRRLGQDPGDESRRGAAPRRRRACAKHHRRNVGLHRRIALGQDRRQGGAEGPEPAHRRAPPARDGRPRQAEEVGRGGGLKGSFAYKLLRDKGPGVAHGPRRRAAGAARRLARVLFPPAAPRRN